MDRVDRQEFAERSILIGLIYSVECLKEIKKIWRDDYYECITGKEVRKIAQWCLAYFDKHHEAPGGNVDDIWMRDDTLSKEEAELLEQVLIKVEEEWGKRNGNFNVGYYYEQTVKHFKTVGIENLKYVVAGEGEIDKIRSMVGEFKPPGKPRWKRASQIQPRPIYWHWENIIPMEELVLLAGYKELGKTQLMCSIAAILSSGRCWPDGTENREPRDVIFLSAEDSINRVVIPRLLAAGADMDRIHTIDTKEEKLPEDTAEAVGWVETLLDDLPNKGRRAVSITDPITAFMGSRDPNNVVHVRSALRSLMEMGYRRSVTQIVSHHLHKGSMEGSALDQVLGSGGFTHAARVVHLVFPDPAQSGKNLFLAGANNLGPKHPGHRYQIVPERVNGNINISRIAWESDPVNMNADQALALMRQSKGRPKIEEAKAWLTELLREGSMPQSRVEEAAKEAGISYATIRKAKDELKIKAKQVGGRWIWRKLSTR
jgi:putative DNA primase/helicase